MRGRGMNCMNAALQGWVSLAEVHACVLACLRACVDAWRSTPTSHLRPSTFHLPPPTSHLTSLSNMSLSSILISSFKIRW